MFREDKKEVGVFRWLSISVAFTSVFMLSQSVAVAAATDGELHGFEGQIEDVRYTLVGAGRTNVSTVTGSRRGEQFLFQLKPLDAEDNIEELIGWDGELLRGVQKWSEDPRSPQNRDQSLGYIESTVFSRYHTHAATGILIALSSDAQRAQLEAGNIVAILGAHRKYPEEDNRYTVATLPDQGFSLMATTPGKAVVRGGLESIPGFPDGFKRWEAKVEDVSDGRDGFVRTFEYLRYVPHHGSLKLYRHVRGRLKLFRQNEQSGEAFSPYPPIDSDSFAVQDFRGRKDLLSHTDGQIDVSVNVTITNRDWDAHVSFVTNQVSMLAKGFDEQPVDQALVDSVLPLSVESRSPVLFRYLIGAAFLAVLGTLIFGWKKKSKLQTKQ